ncbi:hypothetical protein KA107_03690 [Candidatus Pacearchaeota archaeon]|nr:hypothetical protein [Candidatus Pacearchaeota archaeon]
MESEKRSLYEKFDDGVMSVVNKGVRVWNWTTGRTKADLANTLVYTGGAAVPAGCFIRGWPVAGSILAAIYLPGSIFSSKANKKYEELEVTAMEKGLMDQRVENRKEDSRKLGNQIGAIGIIQIYPNVVPTLEKTIGDYTCFSGMEAIALSYYVMRADYLPPRKNVLSRAKDKLVELLNQAEQVPQPAMVPVNYVGK